eukprot:CAMPEP_0174363496 /NCGR_PEP_ID=MMETSP0811_2-20130205/69066_1 /TAXON_ID=73025 ORGANISM="Eutreptiella gymnastica-like, Strain CCMP1594" /NCGR_SAMPLE_ID=MMETSP0811_2 /ASSEMBLY_ACC=CAM_ASM_000667 /LENGTH=72 /DNA_ID=CAMNT_0015502239 /DNA_START=694 /DNA_END=910 /DNA_ORIENTATION=+
MLDMPALERILNQSSDPLLNLSSTRDKILAQAVAQCFEVVPCCLPMSTPSQYCVGVNIRQVHTGHSSSAATA